MGGTKSAIRGTSGQPANVKDGTLGQFVSSIPGIVDGWKGGLERWGEEQKKYLEDLAWRKAGLGYDLSAGDVDKIQHKIDDLSARAARRKRFTAADKAFLIDLYEWIATGGRWKWLSSSPAQPGKGLWEAGELLEHYLHGDGEALTIDSDIYENSTIVRYAMAEIKKVISSDLATTGRIRNGGEVWSIHVLKAKNLGDPTTRGQVLEGGVLLSEQGNARLKYANNRFVLRSISTISATAKAERATQVMTRWRVVDTWDYNSYAEQKKMRRNDVTYLPLRGGKVLRLPDGLSHYLTEEGLAKKFEFTAEWSESWTSQASAH